jgi:hypothetical protein
METESMHSLETILLQLMNSGGWAFLGVENLNPKEGPEECSDLSSPIR